MRISECAGNLEEIPDGALVLLIGPSGCGKTTFARHWKFVETEIVSSDECRRLVADDDADQDVSQEAFTVFYAIIRARLTHGRLTVADATNLTPWSRKRLRQIAIARGRPVVAVAFDAPLHLCLARQHLRERAVPPQAVADQFRLLRQALLDLPNEGYDQIYIVDTFEAEIGVPPVRRGQIVDAGRWRPLRKAMPRTLPAPRPGGYVYGDFPELFQDLVGDAPVDGENPAIIARILADGTLAHLRALVPMDVFFREYENLDLAPHTRLFWNVLMERLKEQEQAVAARE